MIALNKLPRFSNPVFTNPKFDRATDDGFFLYVDSSDKYFNRQSVQELLSATSPIRLRKWLRIVLLRNCPALFGLLFVV